MTRTIDNIVAGAEKDAAAKQTLIQKQAVWEDFLRRLRGNKPANTIENFSFLVGYLETEGRLVTAENLLAALKANLDYLPSGFDRSAEAAAQRQAANDAATAQNKAINDWIVKARDLYGFADTDRNLQLLTGFIKTQHGGVFSELAADHFVRLHGPDIDRLAKPQPADTRNPMSQERAYSPEEQRLEREARANDRKKQFHSDMVDSKARAQLQSELSDIRRYRESTPVGISWSKSWDAQRRMLGDLKRKYASHKLSGEFAQIIDRESAKVGR